jgi:single-strand DNA-binding protein
MNLNKVMIIGNLTRDPEQRVTPSGTVISSFAVATSRKWKGNDGQAREETEFHNITAFGKTAEICGQYLTKGSKVYVEGRLKTETWDDKTSGQKRYKTVVILESLIMLSSKPAGQSSTAPVSAPDTSQPAPAAEEEISVEDLPF